MPTVHYFSPLNDILAHNSEQSPKNESLICSRHVLRHRPFKVLRHLQRQRHRRRRLAQTFRRIKNLTANGFGLLSEAAFSKASFAPQVQQQHIVTSPQVPQQFVTSPQVLQQQFVTSPQVPQQFVTSPQVPQQQFVTDFVTVASHKPGSGGFIYLFIWT